MLERPCDYPECSEVSRAISGDCRWCHKHLCSIHLNSAHDHHCIAEGADLDLIHHLASKRRDKALRALIDGLDLTTTAEELRPGHRARLPPLDDLLSGSINALVPIDFDDGVRWLARIHQTGYYADPRTFGRMTMQGEIDILRWLRDVAGVPVSGVKSDMIVHGSTDFYFTECLPGQAYEPEFHCTISYQQLVNTVTDYAKAQIRISNHPFRDVGSLHTGDTPADYTVGPYINHWSYRAAPPHYPGPFRTSGEKWASICSDFLDCIRAGEPHSDRPALAFCVYSWIRKAVLAYPPFNVEDGPTYLLHEDSKWDMIMADEEGHITGLIDWEWASIGCKAEAFAAPFGFMDSIAVFNGSNELSAAETLLAETYTALGRPDLARCVEGGKVYQRLWWIMEDRDAWSEYAQLRTLGEAMGMDMPRSMEEFMASQKGEFGGELASLEGGAR